MSDLVKRARSPNYPAISLPVALQQLRSLFDRIQKHKAPKEAVLKGLGYGGWNGASATALSAHTKYGILERLEKDEFKISELGMRLLFHKSPEEYAEALYEAATKPPLFAEFLIEYQNTVPHEDIMRPRLIRQGFAQSAVATVIESYRETMKFLSDNAAGYGPEHGRAQDSAVSPQESSVASKPTPFFGGTPQKPIPPLSHGEPYRVSLTRGALEVSAHLSDETSADELIRVLQAWKILLRKMDGFEPKNEAQANIWRPPHALDSNT